MSATGTVVGLEKGYPVTKREKAARPSFAKAVSLFVDVVVVYRVAIALCRALGRHGEVLGDSIEASALSLSVWSPVSPSLAIDFENRLSESLASPLSLSQSRLLVDFFAIDYD